MILLLWRRNKFEKKMSGVKRNRKKSKAFNFTSFILTINCSFLYGNLAVVVKNVNVKSLSYDLSLHKLGFPLD